MLRAAAVEVHQRHFSGYVQLGFWRIYLVLACVATFLLVTSARGRLLRLVTAVLSATLFWHIAFLDHRLAKREFEELCRTTAGIQVFERVELPVDQFDADTGLPLFYSPSERAMGLRSVGYDFYRPPIEHLKGRWGVFKLIRTQIVTASRKPLVEGRSIIWGGGGPPALKFGEHVAACPNVERVTEGLLEEAFVRTATDHSRTDHVFSCAQSRVLPTAATSLAMSASRWKCKPRYSAV